MKHRPRKGCRVGKDGYTCTYIHAFGYRPEGSVFGQLISHSNYNVVHIAALNISGVLPPLVSFLHGPHKYPPGSTRQAVYICTVPPQPVPIFSPNMSKELSLSYSCDNFLPVVCLISSLSKPGMSRRNLPPPQRPPKKSPACPRVTLITAAILGGAKKLMWIQLMLVG